MKSKKPVEGPTNGKRKRWSAGEKLRIVLEGMEPGVEISDLCRREGVNPTMYYQWKRQLLGAAERIFERKEKKPSAREQRLSTELTPGATAGLSSSVLARLSLGCPCRVPGAGCHCWLVQQCSAEVEPRLPIHYDAAMKVEPGHRKLVKHYENLGHARELTFSCFRRLPLLTNDVWREMLSRSIDAAADRHNWRLTAFVYMPEHVHSLFLPMGVTAASSSTAEFVDTIAAVPSSDEVKGGTAGSSSSDSFGGASTIDHLLKAIKRPYSYRIKQLLVKNRSRLMERLTIRQRPGVTTFRFWQEGPGYDRNLESEAAVLAAIEYIHLNPVRRGLCKRAIDWKWSSIHFYLDPTARADPALPKLYSLPPEFFR